jgi:hypothetical protein
MPWEGEKIGEGYPLTRIEKKVMEIRYFIQLIKILSKPKATRIL